MSEKPARCELCHLTVAQCRCTDEWVQAEPVQPMRQTLLRAVNAYVDEATQYALNPAPINSEARTAHRAKLISVQRDMLRVIDALPL